jgi:GH24 family phage-related lysozyme (muramidase)
MSNVLYKKNLTKEQAEEFAFQLKVEGGFEFEVKEEGGAWSVHYWSKAERPAVTTGPKPAGPAAPGAGPSATAAQAGLGAASPSATPEPAPIATTSGPEPDSSPTIRSEGSSGKVPDQAVAIVTEFEGFVDHVYDDGVGVATIGYGTTRYPDGRPVRFGDPNITKATAELYLSHDLETTVHQLSASIPHWNEMNSNQCSALISFAYNLGDHFFGGDGFQTITSTLRDKRWDNVPEVMELYSNPNDPEVHQGLLRRRKDEGDLWQGKGRFAKTNFV